MNATTKQTKIHLVMGLPNTGKIACPRFPLMFFGWEFMDHTKFISVLIDVPGSFQTTTSGMTSKPGITLVTGLMRLISVESQAWQLNKHLSIWVPMIYETLEHKTLYRGVQNQLHQFAHFR